MRHLFRILKFFAALFVAFVLGFHVFMNLKGKEFITRHLNEVAGRPVTIGSFSTSLLFTIYLKNVEIPGIMKVERVYLSAFFPYDIIKGSFGFRYLALDGAVIRAERKRPQPAAVIPAPAASIQPPVHEVLGQAIEHALPAPEEVTVPVPSALEEEAVPAPSAPGEEAVSVPPALPEPAAPAPAAAPASPLPAPAPEPPEPAPTIIIPHFYVNHLLVRDGTFIFTDHAVSAEGLTLSARKVEIAIDNINFAPGGSRISEFKIKAQVPWSQGKEVGTVTCAGWIDPVKKDIRGRLEVANIDALYLYPYYAEHVDLEKTRIESAKLNFTSDINGLNNEVTAQCRLELTDIVFRERAAEESEERGEKIAAAVLDIFRALNQGKVVLEFSVKTRLDRPEFGFGVIKTAVEQTITEGTKGRGVKVDDVVLFPAKVVTGTIRGTADVAKAILGGTVSVGAEFARALGAAFRKDVPAERRDE